MAIRDLLWACPLCGREGGIRSAARGVESCGACGTRFQRGAGSAIVGQRPGEAPRSRPAAEWIELLPAIRDVARLRAGGTPDQPLHRDRVRARFAVGEAVVRLRGVFMNRIERFGPSRSGQLVLEPTRVRFVSDSGPSEDWAFDTLTAVQPSSSTLQIKSRSRPVASFRFPEGSARFWDELLTTTLKSYYLETGRGEILELQPRIVTR